MVTVFHYYSIMGIKIRNSHLILKCNAKGRLGRQRKDTGETVESRKLEEEEYNGVMLYQHIS